MGQRKDCGGLSAWAHEGDRELRREKNVIPLCTSDLTRNIFLYFLLPRGLGKEVSPLHSDFREVTARVRAGPSPAVALPALLSSFPQFSGGLQDLLLPQNQFAMFLYCFIFIHIIYVAKEMVFFLFSKHYLFCLAAILLCLIKTLWSYFQVPLLLPSPTMPTVCRHPTPPPITTWLDGTATSCGHLRWRCPARPLPGDCITTLLPTGGLQKLVGFREGR